MHPSTDGQLCGPLGRDTSVNDSIATANATQRIFGQITYVTGNRKLATDSEAVAVALPVARKPDEKFTIDTLRPNVVPPTAQDPTVQRIRSLGGNFARTGPNGEYKLEVPVGGQYFVLLISSHSRRSVNRPPTTTEIVGMGQYFKQATDLLGENDFSWSKQLMLTNKKLDRIFGKK